MATATEASMKSILVPFLFSFVSLIAMLQKQQEELVELSRRHQQLREVNQRRHFR